MKNKTIKELVEQHKKESVETYYRLRGNPLMKHEIWWCKGDSCKTCDEIEALRKKLFPEYYEEEIFTPKLYTITAEEKEQIEALVDDFNELVEKLAYMSFPKLPEWGTSFSPAKIGKMLERLDKQHRK